MESRVAIPVRDDMSASDRRGAWKRQAQERALREGERHALAERMREVMRLGGSYCEMHGLEHCVKVLRRTRFWSRECAVLRDEIVSFARGGSSSPALYGGRELFLYVA